MMRCRDVAPLIDELVDGTLDPARASAVRGHARGCEACGRQLEETEAMVAAARGLEPLEPPPSLLDGIRARLDQEEARDAERPRWWLWWQVARPQMMWAGAAVLAASLAVTAVAMRRGGGGSETTPPVEAAVAAPAPVEQAPEPAPAVDDALDELARAESDYRKAIGELEQVVASERTRWRPEAARAFDDNLAIIDAAVERQRRVYQENPTDLAALDALHAGYRKQIDYLTDAVMRGGAL